jgi:DNA-directed RNA polymerase specialized sigma24 family protein
MSLPVSVDSSALELRDCSLLLQIADGELAALGPLYDRHAGALLHLARLFDPSDAEDLLVSTFVRVAADAQQFRASSLAVRPWLFVMLARVATERRRRVRHAIRSFARRSSPPDPGGDLAQSLAKLAEPQRLVYLWVEVAGFNCDQIARMLELPVGIVAKRLRAAYDKLCAE